MNVLSPFQRLSPRQPAHQTARRHPHAQVHTVDLADRREEGGEGEGGGGGDDAVQDLQLDHTGSRITSARTRAHSHVVPDAPATGLRLSRTSCGSR